MGSNFDGTRGINLLDFPLDKGTDIALIQKLLGHNDIKTTLRYLHVTNKYILQIISPPDHLKNLLTPKKIIRKYFFKCFKYLIAQPNCLT